MKYMVNAFPLKIEGEGIVTLKDERCKKLFLTSLV